jgi:hypothetical protein
MQHHTWFLNRRCIQSLTRDTALSEHLMPDILTCLLCNQRYRIYMLMLPLVYVMFMKLLYIIIMKYYHCKSLTSKVDLQGTAILKTIMNRKLSMSLDDPLDNERILSLIMYI